MVYRVVLHFNDIKGDSSGYDQASIVDIIMSPLDALSSQRYEPLSDANIGRHVRKVEAVASRYSIHMENVSCGYIGVLFIQPKLLSMTYVHDDTKVLAGFMTDILTEKLADRIVIHNGQ